MSQAKGSAGPGQGADVVTPLVRSSAKPAPPPEDPEITQIASALPPAAANAVVRGFGVPVEPPPSLFEKTEAMPGPAFVSTPAAASGDPGPAARSSTHPPTETLPGARPGSMEVRQVGRYLIQDRLGRGGMATVFKAHDPDIGRDVAIKFLHATLCEDDEYRSRFLREARAAGGLSHPNIVVVHDVGEIEGRPYMAMELLDGQPLSDEMASNKPMPVRDAVIMGIQLARALNYAHSKGIVHRDIKPGNIMRVQGTQTIKVTDFGIAHMESSGSEHRTRVGDILGTPQYMSPEQAQGEKLDGRSDLFSTGIVLYQMLTGQRPFLGDSLVTLALKITKDDPTPIEKLRPDLPTSLRRVVERCLAKAPDRRFQTGKELSDALGRVLVELDETERERSKPRIMPLRVKWAAMMALIVAAVMAVAAAVITQRQYEAMMSQVVDSGAALSRFIAAQNAVSALAEDWVPVEVAVQEVMKTRDFHSVTVTDREGIVRAAGQPSLAGQPYKPPASESLGSREGGVIVSRYVADGETVLGFDAPITFQDKVVGRVALGLPEKPLVHVVRLSMGLMVVLVLVTVLAVAIAMYFVANWFAQPIKLLGDSMDEIARGRFDHRIREQRKDEFGLLYAAFDRMAQALQDCQSGAAASPLTPTPTAQTPTAPVTATLPTARVAAAAPVPGAPEPSA